MKTLKKGINKTYNTIASITMVTLQQPKKGFKYEEPQLVKAFITNFENADAFMDRLMKCNGLYEFETYDFK